MAKKIKEIKRIKKKSLSKKYNFDDDSSNYSIKSTLRNLTILVVLIVAFIATQMVLILPINDKAAKLGPDLIEKNAAIENGKKMQKGLLDKEKKARSALNNLKISFFKTNEGEPFYQFLSNIAIKNRLTISSIKKIDAGKFNEKKGTFNEDLYHFEGKKKVRSKAITHYKVIDSNNNYSLLKLSPETGRKHQIRKHLLMYGHPILGDSKYNIGDSYKNKKKILMLHAHKINFSMLLIEVT